MSDSLHVNNHKKKSLKCSLDLNECRYLRSINLSNSRRNSRYFALSSHRKLPEEVKEVSVKTSQIVKENSNSQLKRIEMLQKWKEEKLLKKKLEKKKPVFKVCHVDNKNSSQKPSTIMKHNPNSISITKSTTSTSCSSKYLKKDMNKTSKIPQKNANTLKSSGATFSKNAEKSFAPSNFKFMPPKGVFHQSYVKGGAAETLRKLREKDSKTNSIKKDTIPPKKTLSNNIDSSMMFPRRELGIISEKLESPSLSNLSNNTKLSTLLDEKLNSPYTTNNMNSTSHSLKCLKKDMNKTCKIPKKNSNTLKSSGIAFLKSGEKSLVPAPFKFNAPNQSYIKGGAAETLRKLREKNSKTNSTKKESIPLKEIISGNNIEKGLDEGMTLNFKNLHLEKSENINQENTECLKENLLNPTSLKSSNEQTLYLENRRPLTRLQVKKNAESLISMQKNLSDNEILSPPKTNTRKISLLYTPRTRKSIRKSIKGDLISFSP